jgi:hypothetical protein
MPIRYVFSVSTGRAGSHYLSEIFRHVEGCVSEHEPEPIMNGRAMRSFLAGDPRRLERLMPEKLAAIQRARGDAAVYVETNHCFIKGFGWLLPDHLPQDQIGVIVLRRDPAKIRASFSRALCTPFLPGGDDWIITPTARPHHVPLPEGFSFPMARFHAYRLASRTVARPGIVRRLTGGRMNVIPSIQRYEQALLDWYIVETYARWEAYRRLFPQVLDVDVDVDDLNTFDGVSAMLARLGLVPAPSLAGVLGRRTNEKPGKPVLRSIR